MVIGIPLYWVAIIFALSVTLFGIYLINLFEQQGEATLVLSNYLYRFLIGGCIFTFAISVCYGIWHEIKEYPTDSLPDPDYVCFLIGGIGGVITLVSLILYIHETRDKMQNQLKELTEENQQTKREILVKIEEKDEMDVTITSKMISNINNISNEGKIKEIRLRGIQGLQIIDHAAEDLSKALSMDIPVKILLLDKTKDNSFFRQRSNYESHHLIKNEFLQNNQNIEKMIEKLTYDKLSAFQDTSIIFLHEIYYRAYILKRMNNPDLKPEDIKIPLRMGFFDQPFNYYITSLVFHESDKNQTVINWLPTDKKDDLITRRGTRSPQKIFKSSDPTQRQIVQLFHDEFSTIWDRPDTIHKSFHIIRENGMDVDVILE